MNGIIIAAFLSPMKKLYLLYILIILSSQWLLAQSQQKTVVYGNLGIENVNISVLSTQYGTSTDTKGQYELLLFDKSQQINLYYSCIGYQDTIVSLMPRQLQRDSVNISFRMRKMSYSLQEVGVTASRDFYRSGYNRNIADIAFMGDRMFLLENKTRTSSLRVLDQEGIELSFADYDVLYESLFIDAFDNIILLGQDSCLQVYVGEDDHPISISTFPREFYRDKLARILFEFNGAYILKRHVHDQGVYYYKYNHGKTQDFLYVLKSDPSKEQRPLYSFVDTLGYLICESALSSIINEYHEYVREQGGIDVIDLGIWDGYLITLANTPGTIAQVQSYCHFLAKEYHILPLKFNDFLQFIDLDTRRIVEIGKDFQVVGERELKVLSGEEFFKREFLPDEATGKTYGLFVKDGVNHLGLYDTRQGTVGMGQKASQGAYPRAIKVHGGYAYSVFYDKGRNQGFISRVKIEG